MDKISIKTIEICGFGSALKAVHLPFTESTKSEITVDKTWLFKRTVNETHPVFYEKTNVTADNEDITLLQKLVKRGDEHAKVLRGIQVWAEINAPMYWWWDLETYTVGHTRLCSASTMNSECRGAYGEELQKIKGDIKFGRQITKIDMFSYQTLRRIYFQRKTHRLPEFTKFCDWIETLPFAKELITVGYEDRVFKQSVDRIINKWIEAGMSHSEIVYMLSNISICHKE